MATKSVKGAGRQRLAPATTLACVCGILGQVKTHEILRRPRLPGGEWVPGSLEELNLESFNYKVGDPKSVFLTKERGKDYVYFRSGSDRSHGPYTMKQAEEMLRRAAPVMEKGGSSTMFESGTGRRITRGDAGPEYVSTDKPKASRTREFLHVGCQWFRWAPLLEFMRQQGWNKAKKSTRKEPKRK